MATLVNLWIYFFGWLPAWFQAFLIGVVGLIALLVLFWILKLIWDAIPWL